MSEFNPATPSWALTREEFQVLRLLARGEPTKRIAVLLGCSPTRVQDLIRIILFELDAHNRTHAVALATRAGLN